MCGSGLRELVNLEAVAPRRGSCAGQVWAAFPQTLPGSPPKPGCIFTFLTSVERLCSHYGCGESASPRHRSRDEGIHPNTKGTLGSQGSDPPPFPFQGPG